MSDKKISQLTASTVPLAGTEVLPVVQSSTTKQVSVANLTAGRAISASSFEPTSATVPTNGMFLGAANSVSIATNSTEHWMVNASGNLNPVGSKGIGTALAPVNGVYATNATMTTGNLVINTSGKGVTTGSAVPLGFGTNNGTSAMTLDTSGRIGIGTIDLQERLTVQDSVQLTNNSGNLSSIFFGVNANPGLRYNYIQADARSNGYMGFNVNIAERMRITGSGVGVGTNDIQEQLTVQNNIQLTNSSGNISGLFFGTNANPSARYTYIQADARSTGYISFTTNLAERLRISDVGDVTVNTGNLVIGTSGKGIDFSADGQAAGMTSELLDDYEEGTWTPSLGGDATYTFQSGTYTKIGRLVIANCILLVNSLGTGATNNVSGLPFTVLSQTQGFGGVTQYFENLANNVVMINPSPNAGANTVTFYTLAAASNTTSFNTAIWQNAARIDFTVMYFV